MIQVTKQFELQQLENNNTLNNVTTIKIGKQDCNITNIQTLSKCINVQVIELFQIQVNNLKPFENSCHLKLIKIYNCPNLVNIHCLKNCKNIQEVYLGYLKINNIQALECFYQLKLLKIEQCEDITDYNVLGSCTNLQNLQLFKTNISDISPLMNLKNLNTIELSGNWKLQSKFQIDIKSDNVKIFELFQQWKQTNEYTNNSINNLLREQINEIKLQQSQFQSTIIAQIEKLIFQQNQLHMQKQQEFSDIKQNMMMLNTMVNENQKQIIKIQQQNQQSQLKIEQDCNQTHQLLQKTNLKLDQIKQSTDNKFLQLIESITLDRE